MGLLCINVYDVHLFSHRIKYKIQFSYCLTLYDSMHCIPYSNDTICTDRHHTRTKHCDIILYSHTTIITPKFNKK